MATREQQRSTTSVRMDSEVKRRLDDIKPFESMSYSDVVELLADVYQGQRSLPAHLN